MTIKIQINNKTYEVQAGQMLIDAAAGVGVDIPRFCYHKKLSVAANCRMCLVGIEGHKKHMPACTIPVSEGMVVSTKSEQVRESQQAVMEFLLINHPLDCPICDQGGECELQDVAMNYGSDVSHFSEAKRIIGDKDIGPLIHTDLTRCIHCTRCVRFGQEIGGIMELGMSGRGEGSEIETFVEKSVNSELSGNVIDLCPVGALTDKPFRYSARAWEMHSRQSIAPHDGIGSNLFYHIKQDAIKRVVPAENEAINEVWLSDRDRFSYEGINAPNRLTQPMIKQAGDWQVCDWQTALEQSVAVLKDSSDNYLISASATLEEGFLLRQLASFQKVGCATSELLFEGAVQLDLSSYSKSLLADIGSADWIFMLGSQLTFEQPILAHRVRQASRVDGTQIWSMNNREHKMHMRMQTLSIGVQDWVECLKNLQYAFSEEYSKINNKYITKENLAKLADTYRQAKQPFMLIGQDAMKSEYAKQILEAVEKLAQSTKNKLQVLQLPYRANSMVLNNLCATSLVNQKYHLTLGLEPNVDFPATCLAEKNVMISAYDTPNIRKFARVLLPMALTAETAGTLVNLQGNFQSFSAAVNPPKESKSAWKILRVLANLLGNEEIEYKHSKEVFDAAKLSLQTIELTKSANNFAYPKAEVILQDKLQSLVLSWQLSPFHSDMQLRHAPALQQTQCAEYVANARVHPDTLRILGCAKDTAGLELSTTAGNYDLALFEDESLSLNLLVIPEVISAKDTRLNLRFVCQYIRLKQ